LVETKSFNSGSGNATFIFNDPNDGTSVNGTITLNNSGGVIAATATESVTFENGLAGTSSHNLASTGALTVSRQSGLAPSDGH
jgi:hypothetical protein